MCDVVSNAFNRYFKIIFFPQNYEIIPNKKLVRRVRKAKKSVKEANLADNLLKRIVVNIQGQCEQYPTLDSDESCKLNVLEKQNFLNKREISIYFHFI